MLLPTLTGLIISTIILNFNLLTKAVFFAPNQAEPVKSGQVLGVSEAGGSEKIFNQPDNGLNKALIKVIEEAKTAPLSRFFKSAQAGSPAVESPEIPVKKLRLVMADNEFTAENGVVLNYDDDSLCFSKHPDKGWPIASITKLFTAYTFLDYNPGWETDYVIKAEDKREGGKIHLFTGDKVKVKDLFYFSLVGSDNTATAALVHATGLSEEEFVEKMNLKVGELGLKNTKLVDPVGLKDGNISTAREIALFAKMALAKEEISRASLTKSYEFKTAQGRKKIITNTNELLNRFPKEGVSLLGGKTGFINSAGYCLVSRFKNKDGREIITVILGADSDNGRFDLTKKLVDLYYNSQP